MLTVDINKTLPDFQLEIKFSIHADILVLLGSSGAGKTTILRCIAGLSQPDRGLIKFQNTEFYSSEKNLHLPPRFRRVGFMFQDYALFPHFTVRKNILFGAKQPTVALYEKLLELLKISHLADRSPAVLSGGEKQRVALARALMAEPQILLLDEPLSALDAKSRLELQSELKKIHSLWQIPFIVVTHNVAEAKALGDRFLFLDKGRQTGIPDYW